MTRWKSILSAEILKVKGSFFVPATFIAFALGPVIGGIFIYLLRYPELMPVDGGLAIKARAMNIGAYWQSYLSILMQAVGVGGVMVFGFAASWIFGREYSDRTAKDLLSLPASRTAVMSAKFAVYAFWCTALAISNLLLGMLIGLLLDLPASNDVEMIRLMGDYAVTVTLTAVVGMPLGFFAVLGKGYLPPLGVMALTLVFAQIIAAVGWGTYFPWSIPGLYSGAGGDYKQQLNAISYGIVAATGIFGYLSAVVYWNYADHYE